MKLGGGRSRIPVMRGLLLLVLVSSFTLSACATARLNRFDGFAGAAATYAESVPPVLDAAFETAVEVDSLVLAEGRKALRDEEARLEAIETSNQNLRQRLRLLDDLKRHAALLRSYFLALRALARAEEASGVQDATRGLVASMGKLHARIREAKVGGVPLEDFMGETSSLAVATFQSAALNAELKSHARVIERELEVQQVVLTAVAEAMRADLETLAGAEDRDRIVMPYVKAGSLPKNWHERRLAAFRRRLDLKSVDAATDAARGLKLGFVALVEDRLDEDGLAWLTQDVDRIVTLAEGVRGSP